MKISKIAVFFSIILSFNLFLPYYLFESDFNVKTNQIPNSNSNEVHYTEKNNIRFPSILEVQNETWDGDQVFTNETWIENSVITLNGNLTIGFLGNLTLSNSTLLLNGTGNGNCRIEVTNGGKFNVINNSLVTTANTSYAWYLVAKPGSTINFQKSIFRHAGWDWGTDGNNSGLWFNTSYIKIEDCSIINNFIGIYLHGTNGGLIFNNTIYNTTKHGIFIGNSPNGNISYNAITKCGDNGIDLDFSNETTIWSNVIINCSYSGIDATNSSNSYFCNNSIQNTIQNGLCIQYSDNCDIINNTFSNSSASGVDLQYSPDCIINNNTIFDSSGSGIDLSSSSDCIINYNNITNSSKNGIGLGSDCHRSSMEGNNIYLCGWIGIALLYDSTNCSISKNKISNCSIYGIALYLNANGSNVISNTVRNCSDSGIYAWMSFESNLTKNDVINCSKHGIQLDYSDYFVIEENTITNNTDVGVYLNASSFCTISSNTFTRNEVGVYLNDTTANNDLFNNIFQNNINYHAWDSNGSNYWDDGEYGNWWDDYSGVDADYNGVGDTPYSIPGGTGIEDHYPLIMIPNSDISKPIIDPTADINYEHGSLGNNISWNPTDDNPAGYYIYRNDSQLTTRSWDGSSITVNIDDLGLGKYNYTIVVFDKAGNWARDIVWVTVVDTTPPNIIIRQPWNISYVGPSIIISLDGEAFHYWYYIENLDLINQSWINDEQRSLEDGFYTLHAFGNDSVGNEGHVLVLFSILRNSNVISEIVNEIEGDGTQFIIAENISITIDVLESVNVTVRQLTSVANVQKELEPIGLFFDISSSNPSAIKKLWINVSFSEIGNQDPFDVRVYFYNETSGKWETLEHTGVDTLNEIIWGWTEHLSLFGLLSKQPEKNEITEENLIYYLLLGMIGILAFAVAILTILLYQKKKRAVIITRDW